MTGVKLAVVGYRGGGPALVDLIGGQMQVMFEGITSSIGYITAGKLRPLGVTSAKRSPALPDVPPIADVVPSYDATGWFGLGAPRGTPQSIIERLNTVINEGLRTREGLASITRLGMEPRLGSPQDFGKLIAQEHQYWAVVARAANF